MKRIIISTLSIALLCSNTMQAHWSTAVVSSLKNHPIVAGATALTAVGGSAAAAYWFKKGKKTEKPRLHSVKASFVAAIESASKESNVSKRNCTVAQGFLNAIITMAKDKQAQEVWYNKTSVNPTELYNTTFGKKFVPKYAFLKKTLITSAYVAPAIAVGATYTFVPAVRRTVNGLTVSALTKAGSAIKTGAVVCGNSLVKGACALTGWMVRKNK